MPSTPIPNDSTIHSHSPASSADRQPLTPRVTQPAPAAPPSPRVTQPAPPVPQSMQPVAPIPKPPAPPISSQPVPPPPPGTFHPPKPLPPARAELPGQPPPPGNTSAVASVPLEASQGKTEFPLSSGEVLATASVLLAGTSLGPKTTSAVQKRPPHPLSSPPACAIEELGKALLCPKSDSYYFYTTSETST